MTTDERQEIIKKAMGHAQNIIKESNQLYAWLSELIAEENSLDMCRLEANAIGKMSEKIIISLKDDLKNQSK